MLSGLGIRRALLLEDAAVASREFTQRLAEELGKSDAAIEVELLGSAPDRTETIDALFERRKAQPPDAIVALGGGRTLDAAKALELRWRRPDLALTDLPPLLDLGNAPGPLLVAVPTTSGSGSEASWAADLRGPDDVPIEVADRALVPDWAIVDPAAAAGLDPAHVLDGAFEALGLATEAYLSAWSNPVSDALALDATGTILSRLAHAVRWSDDPEARGAIHYAATAAGLAASNAQRGLAHALARALERPTGLSYGRLVGIALPPVLDFDHTGARERLETLAVQGRSRDERGEPSLVDRVRRLADQVRFPVSVRAAGGDVPRALAEIDRIAAETARSPAMLANPRIPSPTETQDLLRVILGEGSNPSR